MWFVNWGHVGRCQVKERKIILEQSLLLYGLSTSFPLSLTQGGQNSGTKLRLLVMSRRQMHDE